MNNEYYVNSKDYINRWVVSYADFVTMLLALFMVLYAVVQIDNQKMAELQTQMQEKFNISQKMGYNNVKGEDALEKIFKEHLSQSKSINLIKEQRGMVIRINDKMLFDEGSAVVKPEAEKSLGEIVKILTKIDNPVIIEGHTDSTPIKNKKYSSNWELSTARATNIIAYMQKNGKINPKRLSAVGYGEYVPIADNTSISGRILNRRVDIIIPGTNNN